MRKPILRLRAHHLCCLRFFDVVFEGRGEAFERVEKQIKQVLLAQPQALVMLVEGPDDLCQPCPLYGNGGCTRPHGNEDQVRKFDSILVGELGVSCGDCLTSEEWMDLITPKFPARICRKCQWQTICRMGKELASQLPAET